MSELGVDLEAAQRYFAGSGEALRHADAIVESGAEVTIGADGEVVDHLEGIMRALGSFSKTDMIAGLEVITRGYKG